jgi:hypothetical protein
MTRTRRSMAIGVACLVATSLVAACTAIVPSNERAPTALSGSGEGSGCVDCACRAECDAETAWTCPTGACNAVGTCACDPAHAATDCPSTGCCDAVVDGDGEPMRDPSGAPVYQCVTPSCTTDGDCSDGQVCLAGATCGTSACGCPHGEGPDSDQPCCLAVNATGTCCDSGLVDDAGLCVCSAPLEDHGQGCQCPDNLVEDDQGACVCQDPHATFDAELGACACAAGYRADLDPYSGITTCAADDEGPAPCPDPHAVIDPATQACQCEPGFVLGDTEESILAQCVPATCGDGVCEPNESCTLCSYDCGSCDGGGPPDAGVPDAPPPDAGAPDVGVPDVPPQDAGPRDAPECNQGSGLAICHEG